MSHPPGARLVAVDQYLITYGDLCGRANLSFLLLNVGKFLLEVAEHCQQCGWPPLNALAVNAQSRIPGDAYDGAGGFRAQDWDSDVRKCIQYTGYPARMPGPPRRTP